MATFFIDVFAYIVTPVLLYTYLPSAFRKWFAPNEMPSPEAPATAEEYKYWETVSIILVTLMTVTLVVLVFKGISFITFLRNGSFPTIGSYQKLYWAPAFILGITYALPLTSKMMTRMMGERYESVMYVSRSKYKMDERKIYRVMIPIVSILSFTFIIFLLSYSLRISNNEIFISNGLFDSNRAYSFSEIADISFSKVSYKEKGVWVSPGFRLTFSDGYVWQATLPFEYESENHDPVLNEIATKSGRVVITR